MHNKILNETDFNLLYQQKQALVAALYDHEFIEPDVLEGLINFLDVISDWAEKEGKFKYPEHTEPDNNMLRQELYSMKDHLENLFLTDSIKHSFSHDGYNILNPFYDETGRIEVDPINYYGAELIREYVEKAKGMIYREQQKSSAVFPTPKSSLDSIISRARTIAAEGEALSKDLEKLKNVPTVER